MIVNGGQRMRMPQKFDTRGGNPQRASENECPDGVRSNDDRNERKEGIVDEGAGVDRDLIEAKQEGDQRRQDSVQTEKR